MTLDSSKTLVENQYRLLGILAESVQLRIEAQEQYQKALLRSVYKLNDIPKLAENWYICKLQKFYMQKVHQVCATKQQLVGENESFRILSEKIKSNLDNELETVNSWLRQWKTAEIAMVDRRLEVTKQLRELDEKFVINELSYMKSPSPKTQALAQAILKQQQNISKQYEKNAKKSLGQYEKLKQHKIQAQKRLHTIKSEIMSQLIDYIKKIIIEEVSLIRNIQYDLDNMVKQTNIFEWQPQQHQPVKQISHRKGPDDLLKQNIDHFQQYKQKLISRSHSMQKHEFDQSKFQQILATFQSQKTEDQQTLIKTLIESNEEHYLISYIEYLYRKKQNKLDRQAFESMLAVFINIISLALEHNSMVLIERILRFSATYYTIEQGQRKCIFDVLRKLPNLVDATFWKFYLLFCIQQAVSQFQQLPQKEREALISNKIYSTLLSNSLTMLSCAIEKQQVKNIIVKMAKAYGAIKAEHITELLKFVENGYENCIKKG